MTFAGMKMIRKNIFSLIFAFVTLISNVHGTTISYFKNSQTLDADSDNYLISLNEKIAQTTPEAHIIKARSALHDVIEILGPYFAKELIKEIDGGTNESTAIDVVREGTQKAADAAGVAVKAIRNKAAEGVKSAKYAGNVIENTAAKAANTAANVVGDAAKSIGNTAANTATKVADSAANAANKVGRAFHKFFS